MNLRPAVGENAALSYKRMRSIIGFVGLTLPITCLIAGLADGHLESSISYYYYTNVTIVFTGTLCVVGVFLLAYRLGSLAIESSATTLAGLAALGVALFHTAPQGATLTQLRESNVHTVCAATLFVLLGFISLFIFPYDVPGTAAAMLYRILGGLILLSVLLIPVLNKVAHEFFNRDHVFFTLEAVCVIAFSLSFIAKGHATIIDREWDKFADVEGAA